MACCIVCHLNAYDNEMRTLCTTTQDPDQLKPADFVWAYGAETPPFPVFRVGQTLTTVILLDRTRRRNLRWKLVPQDNCNSAEKNANTTLI